MQARTSATFSLLGRSLSKALLASRRAISYLAGELTGAYRPEKHYMRGPGPKWREKAAAVPAYERRPNATTPS
jgi:hypothetical protein